MQYNWICQVCGCAVDGRNDACETCGCPSSVSGVELFDRKRKWELEVAKHKKDTSYSEIAKDYVYIPSTPDEKLRQLEKYRNSFGILWSSLIIDLPFSILMVFSSPKETAFFAVLVAAYMLYGARVYVFEVINRPFFFFISIFQVICYFLIGLYAGSISDTSKVSPGLIFVIAPMLAFTWLFSFKSKESKQINEAYNKSLHSAN